MDRKSLEVQSKDKMSGVSREVETVRVRLYPEYPLSVGEIARQVEEGRQGKFCPQVGGILLGHGVITIMEVNSILQNEEVKIPVEAVVRGVFYVLKMPSVGTQLYCKVKEKTGTRLTCEMLGVVKVEIFKDPSQWESLYVGQYIVFQVDYALHVGQGFSIVGTMLKPVETITYGTMDVIHRNPVEKKRMPPSEDTGKGSSANSSQKKNKKSRKEASTSVEILEDESPTTPGRKSMDDGGSSEVRTLIPGFRVKRNDVTNRIISVWTVLKEEGRKEFKTLREAKAWVKENPNYLDKVSKEEVVKVSVQCNTPEMRSNPRMRSTLRMKPRILNN